MKIAVSACLLGENCKYNGGNNRSEKVLAYLRKRGAEAVPICPEVLGGLPTPRVPAEIAGGVVTNREGVIVDDAFRRGAEEALRIVRESDAELVILQSRSPSCGAKEIYDGTFTGTLIPGKGVFAEMLEKAGIEFVDAGEI